ncbi:MAG: glycosyltransferase [Pseudomonadota bacterium]
MAGVNAKIRQIRYLIEERFGLGGKLGDQVAAVRSAFDSAFYLRNYPDVAASGMDPARHYCQFGWKEGRDPNPDFSTNYYLRMNPDIADAGINPFVHYVKHGRKERREPLPYTASRAPDWHPLVSVIVPNYNHAAYLPERLASILSQTYTNIELIVLDDCSTDNSRDVIDQILAEAGTTARKIYNETNSGSVFAQWERGIAAATGELVWICESDDTCEPDFLANLVAHFVERSVMMAFGRIEFCDQDGQKMPGMDGFRERSEPGIWDDIEVRTAQQWFESAFSVHNIVANVGGAVFRKQALAPEVWERARKFKIAGDWFLYSYLLRGGKMVFDPRSVAYFRQHARNTSATNFDKLYYYQECIDVHRRICETWDIPAETRERFYDSLRGQYAHFKMAAKHGDFDTCFAVDELRQITRSAPHFLIGLLGFVPGGGEVFPINLANALAGRGYMVSLISANMSEIHDEMLQRLRPEIPVYYARDVAAMGGQGLMSMMGATAVHTHMINCDQMLLCGRDPVQSPRYVVSLHGSYDGAHNGLAPVLQRIWDGVDHWVYTADKNLNVFHEHGFDTSGFEFIPNAMPRDTRPFPQTRAELGIAEDAVVFTLVARGIRQKGWRAAVTAFRRLQQMRPERAMHLILVGEGEATDQARKRAEEVVPSGAAEQNGISFLGYQSCINGLYRLSDCVILPTRFDGESFPLCIIQALQEGKPVIATDIGEIRNMLTSDAGTAGIVLDNIRNSEQFFGHLCDAMDKMLDADAREAWSAVSSTLAERFDMDTMTDRYLDLYLKDGPDREP